MTSACLVFGATGAIGRNIFSEATCLYDHVFAFDITPDSNSSYCDLTSLTDLPLLFRPLSLLLGLSKLDVIFAQRPFVALEPVSFCDDVHNAIDISCLGPIRIIEYLFSTFESSLSSVSFLGSVNSSFVCDQPLSYMVAKSSTDIAIRFLSKRFSNICFRNFILGLVDVPSKPNSFTQQPSKVKFAHSAVGKPIISTDLELSKIIVTHTYEFCLPLSGSSIHLDNGQHFTDPYWSARLADNFS